MEKISKIESLKEKKILPQQISWSWQIFTLRFDAFYCRAKMFKWTFCLWLIQQDWLRPAWRIAQRGHILSTVEKNEEICQKGKELLLNWKKKLKF